MRRGGGGGTTGGMAHKLDSCYPGTWRALSAWRVCSCKAGPHFFKWSSPAFAGTASWPRRSRQGRKSSSARRPQSIASPAPEPAGEEGGIRTRGTMYNALAQNFLAWRSGRVSSTSLEFHHGSRPHPASAFQTATAEARGWCVSQFRPRKSACHHPSLPSPDPANDATRKKKFQSGIPARLQPRGPFPL